LPFPPAGQEIVDLVDEEVQGTNAIPGAKQLVGEMRADEARAAGDEDGSGHPGSLELRLFRK